MPFHDHEHIHGHGHGIAVIGEPSDLTCMLRRFIGEIAERNQDFSVAFNYDPTVTVEFTDLDGSDCRWIRAHLDGEPTLINIDEISTITAL
jgi:hypothetical protein